MAGQVEDADIFRKVLLSLLTLQHEAGSAVDRLTLHERDLRPVRQPESRGGAWRSPEGYLYPLTPDAAESATGRDAPLDDPQLTSPGRRRHRRDTHGAHELIRLPIRTRLKAVDTVRGYRQEGEPGAIRRDLYRRAIDGQARVATPDVAEDEVAVASCDGRTFTGVDDLDVESTQDPRDGREPVAVSIDRRSLADRRRAGSGQQRHRPHKREP